MSPTIDTTAVAVRESGGLARVQAEDFMPLLTVQQAVQRKGMMTEFIGKVMREGEDYGAIPGAGTKKVLLKAGAEKLSSIFGLSPRYEYLNVVEDWTGEEHGGEPLFYVEYKCTLYRGDRLAGEGIGSCNSWESKYRYRQASRKCPQCGGEYIIAGKQEYGGGWLCFKKRGGCGAKFSANDAAITEQQAGRVPNPDIADVVNTVQKMAQKRSLVAAVLVVTNCSDAFTQDAEDFDGGAEPHEQTGNPQAPIVDRRIEEEKAKLAAQRAAAPQPKPAPVNPEHPWTTFAGMLKAFSEIKKRFDAYDTVYYQTLEKYGVKHANEFKPSSLGISNQEARQRAGDCYRDLMAKVKDYEAMKDAPAADAFDSTRFADTAEEPTNG